ncbi:hypothetical protein BX600DRAFT_494923 [Xylariales sp. PMI_506]|nr:hypothetical protein BX600DRAFT_494923 [Xylariales sp. PMI_506]
MARDLDETRVNESREMGLKAGILAGNSDVKCTEEATSEEEYQTTCLSPVSSPKSRPLHQSASPWYIREGIKTRGNSHDNSSSDTAQNARTPRSFLTKQTRKEIHPNQLLTFEECLKMDPATLLEDQAAERTTFKAPLSPLSATAIADKTTSFDDNLPSTRRSSTGHRWFRQVSTSSPRSQQITDTSESVSGHLKGFTEAEKPPWSSPTDKGDSDQDSDHTIKPTSRNRKAMVSQPIPILPQLEFVASTGTFTSLFNKASFSKDTSRNHSNLPVQSQRYIFSSTNATETQDEVTLPDSPTLPPGSLRIRQKQGQALTPGHSAKPLGTVPLPALPAGESRSGARGRRRSDSTVFSSTPTAQNAGPSSGPWQPRPIASPNHPTASPQSLETQQLADSCSPSHLTIQNSLQHEHRPTDSEQPAFATTQNCQDSTQQLLSKPKVPSSRPTKFSLFPSLNTLPTGLHRIVQRKGYQPLDSTSFNPDPSHHLLKSCTGSSCPPASIEAALRIDQDYQPKNLTTLNISKRRSSTDPSITPRGPNSAVAGPDLRTSRSRRDQPLPLLPDCEEPPSSQLPASRGTEHHRSPSKTPRRISSNPELTATPSLDRRRASSLASLSISRASHRRSSRTTTTPALERRLSLVPEQDEPINEGSSLLLASGQREDKVRRQLEFLKDQIDQAQHTWSSKRPGKAESSKLVVSADQNKAPEGNLTLHIEETTDHTENRHDLKSNIDIPKIVISPADASAHPTNNLLPWEITLPKHKMGCVFSSPVGEPSEDSPQDSHQARLERVRQCLQDFVTCGCDFYARQRLLALITGAEGPQENLYPPPGDLPGLSGAHPSPLSPALAIRACPSQPIDIPPPPVNKAHRGYGSFRSDQQSGSPEPQNRQRSRVSVAGEQSDTLAASDTDRSVFGNPLSGVLDNTMDAAIRVTENTVQTDAEWAAQRPSSSSSQTASEYTPTPMGPVFPRRHPTITQTIVGELNPPGDGSFGNTDSSVSNEPLRISNARSRLVRHPVQGLAETSATGRPLQQSTLFNQFPVAGRISGGSVFDDTESIKARSSCSTSSAGDARRGPVEADRSGLDEAILPSMSAENRFSIASFQPDEVVAASTPVLKSTSKAPIRERHLDERSLPGEREPSVAAESSSDPQTTLPFKPEGNDLTELPQLARGTLVAPAGGTGSRSAGSAGSAGGIPPPRPARPAEELSPALLQIMSEVTNQAVREALARGDFDELLRRRGNLFAEFITPAVETAVGAPTHAPAAAAAAAAATTATSSSTTPSIAASSSSGGTAAAEAWYDTEHGAHAQSDALHAKDVQARADRQERERARRERKLHRQASKQTLRQRERDQGGGKAVSDAGDKGSLYGKALRVFGRGNGGGGGGGASGKASDRGSVSTKSEDAKREGSLRSSTSFSGRSAGKRSSAASLATTGDQGKDPAY